MYFSEIRVDIIKIACYYVFIINKETRDSTEEAVPGAYEGILQIEHERFRSRTEGRRRKASGVPRKARWRHRELKFFLGAAPVGEVSNRQSCPFSR